MFFFFQAEDGIRDIGVTGVQTCALPIFTMLRIAIETLRTYRWPVEEPPGAPPVPNGPVGGRRPLDAGAAVSPAAPNANVLVTRKFAKTSPGPRPKFRGRILSPAIGLGSSRPYSVGTKPARLVFTAIPGRPLNNVSPYKS